MVGLVCVHFVGILQMYTELTKNGHKQVIRRFQGWQGAYGSYVLMLFISVS